MRVKMKVAVSGTRNGETWPPIGGVIDLPDPEAESLLWMDLAAPDEPAADRLVRALDRQRR